MDKLTLTSGEISISLDPWRESRDEANTTAFMDALEFLEDQGGMSEYELFDAHKVLLSAIKAEAAVNPAHLAIALEEAVPSLSVQTHS